nr:hypothetical protein [Tanacetum cinerariifolium]GEY39641.1 hypothetical protein [Tanacetum cinerariifolium]
MTDAKEIWKAIKSRFGGNDESKKMQIYFLKQQFESFSVSNSEGLHKGYDRFQSLLSQLETHGAGVSTEDANQKFFSGPQLDHEDLKQVDEFDLEEMDLKWQVAMISTRLKKFYKKTGQKLHFDAKEPVVFDKSKKERCRKHWIQGKGHGKRPAKQDEHKAMVTVDGEGVDWTGHAEDETEDYALIAYKAIQAPTLSQMSAKDKSGLRYGSQIHDGVLSYENEVFASIFNSRSSDVEDNPVTDRFTKVKGMHVVPPHMTGNYMHPKSDFGIDESKFRHGPKQSTISVSNAKTNDLDSCDSNSSVKTLESVPKPVADEPKAVSKPKVWSDAPIIEEYESDIDDEHVKKDQEGNSNAKTLQQNGVAERKNMTLIEVARTMLANSFLPNTFWAKAVSIACYVLNRVKRDQEGNSNAKTLQQNGVAERKNMTLIEDLLLQAGAARGSSTTFVNIATTPLNAASTPTNQDDSQIPALEDIYDHSRDGIFTSASYDDEGAVADFTNLETTMNISQALEDESWVDAMHEELLNKKDERGVVVRNKARLVAQGHRQEEWIDYDEVFVVARIEAIRIFLAFASYMGLIVYLMDVKSSFLYGKIDKEVYVSQPPGFIDPKFPNKVYKVVKALYGLHQALKACVKTASTSIETKKPLVKDEEVADVDVHFYRSVIGSLMYLTFSRLDIMYAVCACSRFQATLKTLHLQDVKRIFSKNPVFHSKTKHTKIRHHFIRDAYEKKLIQVLKIHTDDNVADLLTKAFDVSRWDVIDMVIIWDSFCSLE